ncbi:MAG: hypothetical protein ABI769_16830 [Pseudomonadota bacterium]
MLKILRISFIAGLASWPLLAAEAPAQPQGIAPPTRIPYVPSLVVQSGTRVSTSTIPREVRRAVVSDAARRFRVAESAVVLVHAEQMTWSDGSLGCPEPGQMYTQSVVPGFRVVARTVEGEFLYHTDSRGKVLVCAPAAG